ATQEGRCGSAEGSRGTRQGHRARDPGAIEADGFPLRLAPVARAARASTTHVPVGHARRPTCHVYLARRCALGGATPSAGRAPRTRRTSRTLVEFGFNTRNRESPGPNVGARTRWRDGPSNRRKGTACGVGARF